MIKKSGDLEKKNI